jgi:allene oxide cyclase
MKKNLAIPASLAVGTLSLTAATRASSAEHFVVVEHPVNETTVHVGAKVDSVGDILSFANPFFDAANKTQIGTDQGFCVRTIVGKSWECAWTMLFKEGRITVQGDFADAGDSLFTVTGGTGKYAGAKGQMKLHVRPGKPEAYDFIFDLL